MKRLVSVCIIALCLTPIGLGAQEPTRYGPFVALTVDKDVVQDVLVEANDIYVKVAEEHWGQSFTVKISDENMAGYRNWMNGEPEMTVSVYRSNAKGKQGYTYRIHTTAPYVEYWMGGAPVLHLSRAQ